MPFSLSVALTGNVASGKSTVADMLRERGATIIDADILARRAVDPDTPGYHAILERFGKHILSADGTIDRPALRRRVFNSAAERDALNAIVHPIVARLRDDEFRAARARGDAIIVSDIPLLYEVGLEHAFDAVILVDAPEQTRLDRLIYDRHLPEADARAMIAAQMPAQEKRPRATWVIDNDGSRDQLAQQVDALWASMLSRTT